jgi:hypothetical protein
MRETSCYVEETGLNGKCMKYQMEKNSMKLLHCESHAETGDNSDFYVTTPSDQGASPSPDHLRLVNRHPSHYTTSSPGPVRTPRSTANAAYCHAAPWPRPPTIIICHVAAATFTRIHREDSMAHFMQQSLNEIFHASSPAAHPGLVDIDPSPAIATTHSQSKQSLSGPVGDGEFELHAIRQRAEEE